eukprot:4940937-Amphidinium_carterae.2
MPLLRHRGVSAQLRNVLQSMETGLWAKLPCVAGVEHVSFASTPAGIRQGCSLSPWLFAIYMSAVTDEMDGLMAEAGLTFSVPVSAGFRPMEEGAEECIAFNSLLYADDVVYPRVDICGRHLLKANRQLMEMAKAVFRKLSLEVNQGVGKTELAVHFPRKSSELRAGVMAFAKVNGATRPCLRLGDGTDLIVCEHRQKIFEVRVRRSQAFEAVAEFGPVLKHAHIPVKLKVETVASRAVARLVFCIGAHNWYSPRDIQSLAKGYHRILRAAAGETLRSRQQSAHTSTTQLVLETKMPTFTALRYQRVISLFYRLARSKCKLTHAVVMLASGSEHAWQGVVVKALWWLKGAATTFANMDDPSIAGLEVWAEMCRVLGDEFKQILKAAVAASSAVLAS